MRFIERYIEFICQKPEHIRIRYVFVFTTVCMFGMIGIWLLSTQRSFLSISEHISRPTESKEFFLDTIEEHKNDFTESLKSLESLEILKEEDIGNEDEKQIEEESKEEKEEVFSTINENRQQKIDNQKEKINENDQVLKE